MRSVLALPAMFLLALVAVLASAAGLHAQGVNNTTNVHLTLSPDSFTGILPNTWVSANAVAKAAHPVGAPSNHYHDALPIHGPTWGAWQYTVKYSATGAAGSYQTAVKGTYSLKITFGRSTLNANDHSGFDTTAATVAFVSAKTGYWQIDIGKSVEYDDKQAGQKEEAFNTWKGRCTCQLSAQVAAQTEEIQRAAPSCTPPCPAPPPLVALDELDYSTGPTCDIVTLTVCRIGNTTGYSRVSFHTDNLTAFAGIDYEYTAGDLDFGPGESQRSFTVRLLDHGFFGFRAFHITLTSKENCRLPLGLNGALVDMEGAAPAPLPQHPTTISEMVSTMGGGFQSEDDRLHVQNWITKVLQPGLPSVSGVTQGMVPVQLKQPFTPGLWVEGKQVKQNDDVYRTLITYNNLKGTWKEVTEKIVTDMITSTQTSYTFPDIYEAKGNLTLRILAPRTMFDMEGGKIDFGYANTKKQREIDRTYWEVDPIWWSAATKDKVDLYDAILGKNESVGGLVHGTTKLECLSANEAAYFIGLAKTFTKEHFKERIAAPIRIGLNSPTCPGNPLLTSSLDFYYDRGRFISGEFLLLKESYSQKIRAGQKVPDMDILDKLTTLKKQINGYLGKSKIQIITGDKVYFVNSRFYTQAYPNGMWQGENTIALRYPGFSGYVGLGLFSEANNRKWDYNMGLTEDQINQLLKEKMDPERQDIKEFLNLLAQRETVVASATAKE